MARATTTESIWRRLFLAPLRAGGIALFVVTPFAGTAISHFIDCNDAFWAVACGEEAPIPTAPTSAEPNSSGSETLNLEPADEVLGISVVIDSTGDPTCRTLANGMEVCNS